MFEPNIIDCEQYSQEWHDARRGKVSASRLSEVMSKGRSKNEPSVTRAKYLAQLAAERITGQSLERNFSSEAMEWGTLHEDKAASLYALRTGNKLERVGLVMHPRLDDACASPDRLIVGSRNLVEIKCPDIHTHAARLDGDWNTGIETNYMRQVQWQMVCMGAEWTDFVSFDPRWSTEMQLVVKRIERDPVMIAEIEAEVVRFLADVDAMIVRLVSKYVDQAA